MRFAAARGSLLYLLHPLYTIAARGGAGGAGEFAVGGGGEAATPNGFGADPRNRHPGPSPSEGEGLLG